MIERPLAAGVKIQGQVDRQKKRQKKKESRPALKKVSFEYIAIDEAHPAHGIKTLRRR